MRRTLVSFLSCSILLGCGGGGGGAAIGGGDTGDGTEVPWPSYNVATSADLPTCPGTNITGRIYYVEADENFQACKSTGWTVINTGTYITSNKGISAPGVDYCTEFAGEVCGFDGGQIVKYSDGTVIVIGQFTFTYQNGGDTDLDTISKAIFIAPSSSVGSNTLSLYVARGTGYKKLWLVYTRSTDTLTLVHDTSGDGVMGAGDTTLATLTAS